MARRFKLFGRDVVIGKRLFGLGKDDNFWGQFSGDYTTDNSSFNQLDSYQGFVYALINRVAEACAQYQPLIQKPQGDQWVTLPKHEFLDLLHRPGGKDDKAIPISLSTLIFTTMAFKLLQADCYWYMAKGQISGRPREITILRRDKVGRKLDENGDIMYFYVRTASGEKIRIEIDEMIPFIGFNPRDPYTGLSTTEAARDYIKTDEYSTTFTKNFFKNNAGISGVLSIKGDVVREAFKKFVRSWRNKYEGVDNAGKTAIIKNTEVDFTKVGLGLNELDMSALRNMSREDLAMMFGVPMALLGKAEQTGLGRANVEAFEYIFAKYTIEPKLKMLDEVLEFALHRYYGDDTLRIRHESIIPEDKEHALNVRDKAVDRWLTRDEIRSDDGLDPKPGGDLLFVPLNNIPIDESSLAESSAAASQSKSITVKVKRVVKKDMDIDHKEVFRSRLMRNQLAYERRYSKAFKPILVEQRKEALKNLEAHASSLAKAADQKLFDDAAADAEMNQQLTPVLKTLAQDQGALALVFAGDDESEFVVTPQLERAISDSTRKMAKNFNDETLERLNRTLAEGIQAGDNIEKMRKRVEEVYDQAERYRTRRIARTETLKASNMSSNFAYKQTGYVTGKEWYVNPGADAECESFAGKTVPLDDPFLSLGESYEFTDEDGEVHTHTNDYDTVETPPLHPNCRCTIIPVR